MAKLRNFGCTEWTQAVQISYHSRDAILVHISVEDKLLALNAAIVSM